MRPASDDTAGRELFHNWRKARRPRMRIVLSSDRITYATSDEVSGAVVITPPEDVVVGALSIHLVGTTTASTHRPTYTTSTSGIATKTHEFLRVLQPGLPGPDTYDMVLKAGREYSFPFGFIVPTQLGSAACQHQVSHPSVCSAHLKPPPSFGLGHRRLENDDMAPRFLGVRYLVECILVGRESCRQDLAPVARVTQEVNVIPVLEENPPQLITSGDASGFCLEKEIRLRGLWSSTRGDLRAITSEPRALCATSTELHGSVVIHLQFWPKSHSDVPPMIKRIRASLKVYTFCSTSFQSSLMLSPGARLALSQDLYSSKMHLSRRDLEGARCQWYASGDTSMGTENEGQAPIESFRASLTVPIQLPSTKTFVPTFHTCLISRTYALRLEVRLTDGARFALKTPVQILAGRTQGEQSYILS